MRFRYRQREASKPGDRQYDVRAQEAPRGRWQDLGWVMGLSHEGGPASWAGLRNGADAWTEWHDTRQAAADDMAAGRTFRTRQLEEAAEAARIAGERMHAEALADQARMSASPAPAPDLEAS